MLKKICFIFVFVSLCLINAGCRKQGCPAVGVSEVDLSKSHKKGTSSLFGSDFSNSKKKAKKKKKNRRR